MELFNLIASILGIISFFLGLFINRNVKRYRLELIEYMDNDFDLKKLNKLLECILFFVTSILEDGNFDKQAYTYIFGNCNNYIKFDIRIKKSVKKLRNYDEKIKKKILKEKKGSLDKSYIADFLNVAIILKELSGHLERINENEKRELVRGKK